MSSNVKIVDLTTKQITDFGPSEPIGGLDGLEPAGDGTYLVTDFFAGKLLSVSPNGDVMELMELGPGSADLEFVPAMALVVVPIMNEGAVVGFEGGWTHTAGYTCDAGRALENPLQGIAGFRLRRDNHWRYGRRYGLAG